MAIKIYELALKALIDLILSIMTTLRLDTWLSSLLIDAAQLLTKIELHIYLDFKNNIHCSYGDKLKNSSTHIQTLYQHDCI